MKAFILAGGFATRLWPLTEKRAKPLLPLAGKPLLSHIVEKIPSDIDVTVSTNAAFKEGFEQWKADGNFSNVTILIEDTKSDDQKLGALGAVRQWIETHNIDDDVLLLTGANYFGFSIQDFLQTFSGNALLAAHDIGSLEHASAFGTVLLESGTTNISAFEEKPANPKTTLVSTGCSILPKDCLPILLEYARNHPDNVGGIFEELLRQKRSVECFTFEEEWFDIGAFDAYLDATQKLVGNSLLIEDSAVCTDSDIQQSVVIGKGCTVENAELENVVLFENCTIRNATLRNCILDCDCIIEGIDLNGKMHRRGTELTSTFV